MPLSMIIQRLTAMLTHNLYVLMQASKKIAEADNALHALGQELLYAAEGRLQSNSGTRTAMQGEPSNGGATEGAAGRMEEDATAILAMHNEVSLVHDMALQSPKMRPKPEQHLFCVMC